MASVCINKIEYDSGFNKISDSKAVFNRIYKKYKDPKDSNRVFTIVSAMVAVARTELKESGSFKEVYQKIYDVIRGYNIDRPKCVVCREREVAWNDKTFKYARICNSPACKEKLRADYRNNMMVTHGTDNPMDIPGHVNKMLQSRDIAIDYEWSDGNIKTMIGKQEYAIVEALDTECGLKSFEVEVPGPQIIYYHAIDRKDKLHIPDIFIPKLNLIISGKDGVDNPNTHPNYQKDRLNSIYEYIHILNKTDYNFVQIEGLEDVKNIKSIIASVEKAHSSGSRYIIPPRVDIMMVKNSLSQDDESAFEPGVDISYNFILNSQGMIVLSWFSLGDITKGLIISNGKFMWYNFKKLFNGRFKICVLPIKWDKPIQTINTNIAYKYNNNLQLLYALKHIYSSAGLSVGDRGQFEYTAHYTFDSGIIDGDISRVDICKTLSESDLLDIFKRSPDVEYDIGQYIGVVMDKHGTIWYRFNTSEDNGISIRYSSDNHSISLTRNIKPRCIYADLISIDRKTAEALYHIMCGLIALVGDNESIKVSNILLSDDVITSIRPDKRVSTLCNISHTLVKMSNKYFGTGIEDILDDEKVMSIDDFRSVVFGAPSISTIVGVGPREGGRDEIYVRDKVVARIESYARNHIKDNKNNADMFTTKEDADIWAELAIFRQEYSYIKTRDKACARLAEIFNNTATK